MKLSALEAIQSIVGRTADASDARRATHDESRPTPGRASDRLTDGGAQMIAVRWKSAAPVRTEMVSRMRQEIQAGRYDTPERLSAALDRMISRAAGR